MSFKNLHPSNLTSSTNIAFCRALFSGGLLASKHVVFITVLCVVNALSSVVASTANALVLWAIKKTPSLHNPSSALLCVLASLYLTVGVLIQPLSIISFIGLLTNNYPVYCIAGTIEYPLGIVLGGSSFVTVAAFSFDRYLALALHMRYAEIVTISRVLKCILPTTAFFLILAILGFWFAAEDWFRNTVTAVCLFVIACYIFVIPFAYYRIFAILRRHKKQIHDQTVLATRAQGCPQINISKYRRSVSAILYLLWVIILSYFPCAITIMIVWRRYTDSTKFVLRCSWAMGLLNSSINPLVYCWRIKQIRRFVVLKLRGVLRAICLLDGTVDITQVQEVSK